MKRREFIERGSAAIAMLIAHEAAAIGAASPRPAGRGAGPNEPLIRGLRLLTAAPLPAMREFYHGRIGFAVTEHTEERITFAAGATPLTFLEARPEQIRGQGGRGAGEPFYHFAFNIPHNRLLAARSWQLERSPLVPPRADLVDPAFPDDVWHFRNWNAHSIFFFDPAFNIVEYIARHSLDNAAPDPRGFSTADILYASEIGYVVSPADQQAAAMQVRTELGLRPYPSDTQPWWAMGDERGLVLLLGRKGDLWAENTDTPVRWDVFPTEATVRGSKPGSVELEGHPYQIRVVAA